MTTKMTKTILLVAIGIISNWIYSQTTNQPEINIVNGNKHIFTIETPNGWKTKTRHTHLMKMR